MDFALGRPGGTAAWSIRSAYRSGRTSQTRAAANIPLLQDKPHHWFAGLLVENADDWDEETQSIGTEDRMGFLVFPQGGGKVRLYGGYSLNDAKRFSGPEGPQRFREAFNVKCSSGNSILLKSRPAGPLMSYVNHDSRIEFPFSNHIVLIGNAAGWNDPPFRIKPIVDSKPVGE